jgi:hypothetical protein
LAKVASLVMLRLALPAFFFGDSPLFVALLAVDLL